MGRLVQEAIEAGALGFSTSRTLGHRAMDGEPVPGTFAAEDELFGLGRAMAAGGRAVFELAPQGVGGRGHHRAEEGTGVDAAARRRDRPADLLRADPGRRRPRTCGASNWTSQRPLTRRAAELYPQIAARPFGMLFGFPGHHAFTHRPTFRRLKAECSREELARAAGRARGQGGDPGRGRPAARPERACSTACSPLRSTRWTGCTRIGEPPDYEPTADRTVAKIAARTRRGSAGHDVRPDARSRRRRDADAAVLQLLRRQPRRDPRDADPSRRCTRTVRRRRALRHDLRRVVSHLPADALGARSSSGREAAAGVRHPQAVSRHRGAVRALRPRGDRASERRPTSTSSTWMR